MFQNFDAPASPVTGNSRLKLLRKLMRDQKIDAVIIPHADEQNNEYLPAEKERLAWISGFTGSAGNAIVSSKNAVLLVDGRYTLQANEQTDPDHWQIESLIDTPLNKWIEQNLPEIKSLGIDPWLHSTNQVKSFKKACKKSGALLVELRKNPIDKIWDDQPAPTLGPAHIHNLAFVGRLTHDKMQDMQAVMETNKADICVLTDPASVCWLFNIRGEDVAHTPIVLTHAILRRDAEPKLFIDQRKLAIDIRAFLTQVSELCAPSDLEQELRGLSDGARVMLDGNRAAHAFTTIVKKAGGTVVYANDPAALPRAIKNKVEIEGSKSAHLRDGAALTSFLFWLDQQPPNTIDEITAAKKLEEIRTKMTKEFPLRDISFDTISGAGPNGAIVHYRVNENTNRMLKDGELYLCDSGAQYNDGTTDITRTIAIGDPGKEERRAFSRLPSPAFQKAPGAWI